MKKRQIFIGKNGQKLGMGTGQLKDAPKWKSGEGFWDPGRFLINYRFLPKKVGNAPQYPGFYIFIWACGFVGLWLSINVYVENGNAYHGAGIRFNLEK